MKLDKFELFRDMRSVCLNYGVKDNLCYEALVREDLSTCLTDEDFREMIRRVFESTALKIQRKNSFSNADRLLDWFFNKYCREVEE